MGVVGRLQDATVRDPDVFVVFSGVGVRVDAALRKGAGGTPQTLEQFLNPRVPVELPFRPPVYPSLGRREVSDPVPDLT